MTIVHKNHITLSIFPLWYISKYLFWMVTMWEKLGITIMFSSNSKILSFCAIWFYPQCQYILFSLHVWTTLKYIVPVLCASRLVMVYCILYLNSHLPKCPPSSCHPHAEVFLAFYCWHDKVQTYLECWIQDCTIWPRWVFSSLWPATQPHEL